MVHDDENTRTGPGPTLRELLIEPDDGWLARFAVLMLLASTIAALGMRLNSSSIVVGAMLIAPLMGPILGATLAMVSTVGRQAIARTGLLVAASVVGVVAVGALSAVVVPSADIGIASEVLARTAPDVRDFLVAVAAGAAGAYAAFQPKVSSSVPGVAVAVALVPPLVASGITFAEGERSLAVGAFTLFLANVIGITVGGAVTMLVLAVRTPGRLVLDRRRVIRSGVGVALATVVLVTPLSGALVDAIDEANAERDRRAEDDRRQSISADIATVTLDWITTSEQPGLEVASVAFDSTTVPVDVVIVLLGDRGSFIPALDALDADVADILDRAPGEVIVDLRLIAIGDQATTGPTLFGVGDADPELQLEFRAALAEWLAEGGTWFVDSVEIDDSGIVARIAVAGDPPPISELEAIVEDRISPQPPFSVVVTELLTSG